MGPSLANIDGLLKMPYGCGEQNMLNFAPNIFIMQYLQATHQLTDEIKQKATDYTLQGMALFTATWLFNFVHDFRARAKCI